MNRLHRRRAFVVPSAVFALLSLCFWSSSNAQPTPLEVAKLVGSDSGNLHGFGASVAVDGNTAVIGEFIFGAQGSQPDFEAYVFTRSGGAWTEQQKLTLPGTPDFFGVRVAISGDTILVSGLGNADEAWVFTRSGGVWTAQQRLAPSDPAVGVSPKGFGIAVALSGDTAVIGASADTHAGIGSGAAYVFTRSGTVWAQQAKLTANDAGVRDFFGGSVALSGDTAVIGAHHLLKPGNGAAYAFTRSGGSWSQQAKLTASDAAEQDFFGVSVAVSGDTALVGAFGDDDAGPLSGSAYVYTRNGGVWTEQAKLTASAEAEGDRFGVSVALDGVAAVIGAPGNGNAGARSGSTYVFTRSGGGWTEHARITASDAAAGDDLGASVAVMGDTALIGAAGDDDQANASGAAYVFALGVDPDGDGLSLGDDNCPTLSNPDQADTNGDGHGDACVPLNATIGASATIGPGLIMGQRSRIVGAAQIGDNFNLGPRSNILGPNAIGDDVTVGNLTTVLPGASIGNDVDLGDRAVVLINADIADGVRIGNGVIVGLESFVGADSVINDNTQVGLRSSVGTSVSIGSNVDIGAFARIGDGAQIGDNVRIGIGATVVPGAVVPPGTRIRPGARFPR